MLQVAFGEQIKFCVEIPGSDIVEGVIFIIDGQNR
jgi:hypothetical protein